MGIWALILSAFWGIAQAADNGTRCERLQSLFLETLKKEPKACAESKEVFRRYQLAQFEVFQECRRIEARVAAGEPRLKQGTADEMHGEVMDIRQRDISEQQALLEKVGHELLRTPIDSDSPANPPAVVDDDCANEIEHYIGARRRSLTALGDLFRKLEELDDKLLYQAEERGTRPTPVPVKAGR